MTCLKVESSKNAATALGSDEVMRLAKRLHDWPL